MSIHQHVDTDPGIAGSGSPLVPAGTGSHVMEGPGRLPQLAERHSVRMDGASVPRLVAEHDLRMG
jgi:hypothetical protein